MVTGCRCCHGARRRTVRREGRHLQPHRGRRHVPSRAEYKWWSALPCLACRLRPQGLPDMSGLSATASELGGAGAVCAREAPVAACRSSCATVSANICAAARSFVIPLKSETDLVGRCAVQFCGMTHARPYHYHTVLPGSGWSGAFRSVSSASSKPIDDEAVGRCGSSAEASGRPGRVRLRIGFAMQWLLAGPCGLEAVVERMHAAMRYAGHTSCRAMCVLPFHYDLDLAISQR